MGFKDCFEKLDILIFTGVDGSHPEELTVLADVNEAAVSHSGISWQLGKG